MLCLHESGVMFIEANRALIRGGGMLPDGSEPFLFSTGTRPTFISPETKRSGKDRNQGLAGLVLQNSEKEVRSILKVSVEELKRLEEQDIRELKREDLDNAGDIVIDRSVPANKRMLEFLEKTKNPYAENVGDYILKVTYSKNTEDTLEDKMVQLAKRMTRIPL